MTADILDDVVRALQEGGVDAVRRDWALGRTVVVLGGACSDQKGVVVWERVVWVVDDEGLSVVHPDVGTLARGLSVPDAARIALLAVGHGGPVWTAAANRVRVVERGSTLDGCPLEPWLDQPRALDKNGK